MSTSGGPRESRARRWHRDLHERRALSVASEAACRQADESTAAAAGPVRLDDDQRLAQIDHARRHGFADWEVAQLVPAPVTPAERARAGTA